MKDDEKSTYSKIFVLLIGITTIIISLVMILPFVILGMFSFQDLIPESDMKIAERTDFFGRSYDVNVLTEDSEEHKKIKYGYELITNTYKYIGPDNGNSKLVFAGNNLACKNCHLESGTKSFSAPYIGVTNKYPRFSKRGGGNATLEDRVNGCMERSMNGKKLPVDGREMESIIAYMTWLSKDVPEEFVVKESGFLKMEVPDRAVDLDHGQQIYTKYCVSCHLDNGEGVKLADAGYVYPPLSGNNSYNHGAGMHRVLTSARFIKGNMPFGATAENPILTDEEAFDVAGFINTFNRPKKLNTGIDFPDRKFKPMSTPYGPYADNFSQEQHKFGPYKEIYDFYLNEFDLKKTK